MKKLVIGLNIFGPYKIIEELEDRYRCDGADLPYSVVGQGIISDAQENDFVTEEIIEVPEVVSMVQARKALILGGISIASVDNTIGGIVDDVERELAQTDWEYSTTVRRDSPLVASLGPLLSLTDSEVNDLFILANTL